MLSSLTCSPDSEAEIQQFSCHHPVLLLGAFSCIPSICFLTPYVGMFQFLTQHSHWVRWFRPDTHCCHSFPACRPAHSAWASLLTSSFISKILSGMGPCLLITKTASPGSCCRAGCLAGDNEGVVVKPNRQQEVCVVYWVRQEMETKIWNLTSHSFKTSREGLPCLRD